MDDCNIDPNYKENLRVGDCNIKPNYEENT